jgi:hypothetical protein
VERLMSCLTLARARTVSPLPRRYFTPQLTTGAFYVATSEENAHKKLGNWTQMVIRSQLFYKALLSLLTVPLLGSDESCFPPQGR